MGPAVNYHIYPFSDNFKGFVTTISARYWFYLDDDLKGGEFQYIDEDSNTQTHNAKDFSHGLASGFGVNFSIGYTF